jgi:hypothetical protein
VTRLAIPPNSEKVQTTSFFFSSVVTNGLNYSTKNHLRRLIEKGGGWIPSATAPDPTPKAGAMVTPQTGFTKS